jgi:hypothetical protein
MEKHSRTNELSPNTIKRYATDLKVFLGWCVDKDFIVKWRATITVAGQRQLG